MKRLIVISLVSMVFVSVVFAQGQQGEQGQGIDQGEQIQIEQQVQNQGEEQNLMIQERTQLEVQKLDEVEQGVQQKEQEMNQEMQQMEKSQQNVYKNQNEVRLAVHSLLTMEDVLGGIGPQVSEVATEFNNSVQATIRAEEEIQTRNRIVRFFAGGDKEAAGTIEQEVNTNRERIQQLIQLKEECDCGDEVKTMLQEQIENIEQEQNRLQQLAQNEKQYQWLFGRFFGWLGRLF